MPIQSRRNVLTLLGLAAASSPVIAGDDVATSLGSFEPPAPGDFNLKIARVDHVKMATALRNMADALDNEQIGVTEFTAVSTLNGNGLPAHDEWLKTTLVFKIELLKADA